MKALRIFLRKTNPTWVTFVATLGPIGTKLPAPGTMGSAVGLLWYWAIFAHLGSFSPTYFIVLLISFYVAALFCAEAEFRIGRKDPGEVIIDEFVAMPVCFIGFDIVTINYQPWVLMLMGFLIFRFFDILKPLGIKSTESIRKGWGVVLDDVCAAALTSLTMHVGVAIIHSYHFTHVLYKFFPFLFKA